MDVITIESKAYHDLVGKIEKILRYVEKEEQAKEEYENRLITNKDLAEILGISQRTHPPTVAKFGTYRLQDYPWTMLLRLKRHRGGDTQEEPVLQSSKHQRAETEFPA